MKPSMTPQELVKSLAIIATWRDDSDGTIAKAAKMIETLKADSDRYHTIRYNIGVKLAAITIGVWHIIDGNPYKAKSVSSGEELDAVLDRMKDIQEKTSQN